MKKFVLFALTVLCVLSGCQPTKTGGEQTALIGPSQLNVESLLDSLDLQMDISQLSLSDLYILRHALAARRGYPFKDSYLRGIFLTTTWYDSLMWKFDDTMIDTEAMDKRYDETLTWRDNYYLAVKPEALTYSDEELAFIKRVKDREEQLLKQNFLADKGQLVRVQNIVNPGVLKTFDAGLQQCLGRQGFAIVPAAHQQLFHVYEQNDYHEFPSFVTTDLYLQLYHLYFDALLRDIEEQQFYGLLQQFCTQARRHFAALSDDESRWLTTYFNVAIALLQEKAPADDADALHEYEQVMKSENNLSTFLGYTDATFEYSLFRPRGHYTRTETLSRYFRAMMWLQTVSFATDKEAEMKRAVALARVLVADRELNKIYKTLTEPMTWLMGEPDDVSILQVWHTMNAMKMNPDFAELCKQIDVLAERQTRIRPKFQHTSRNKVRLMPQRYQPDAEVLQEMVDYDSPETKRDVPSGLDVLAAMGCSKAERILIKEQEEDKRWKGFKPNLQRMKHRMDTINWNDNIATLWLSTLKTLTDRTEKAPYFMQTEQWDKKSLNAALASWAQLKHDAILYAKQPLGAECGGGGIPDPVVRGYVEPNIKFWQRAILLLEQTETLFNTYGLQTERSKAMTARLMEELQFLLRISEKELKGKKVTDEEYDQLQYIGAAFENMSIELIRNPGQQLYEWSDIQGPERNVALIADVYTANADNNPEKSILYEGVGQADEIYVIVEIEGYLHLMRGAVFSYRELKRPYGEQRMNDEEWQQKLEKDPRLGVPLWMKEITVPVEEKPVDNEEVFYSSGC